MKNKIVKINTEKTFTDITEMAKNFVKSNNVECGMISIFVRHTTCGIAILEDEKLLMADYQRVLDSFAPEGGFYAHNIIEARDVPPEERINGHSHIRSLFFQPTINVPIIDGELMLGKWQTIFLVELDPSREREIIFTI